LTWIRRSLNEFDIKVADLSPEIAVESAVLHGFYRDPADQIIVATSRILGIPLITSDKQILEFSEVHTIWQGTIGCPQNPLVLGKCCCETCLDMILSKDELSELIMKARMPFLC